MKTIQEILKQESVYINDWGDKIDVIGDFEDIYITSEQYFALESPYPNTSYWEEKKAAMTKAIEDYKDIDILFASYGNGNYEGEAWVLFSQGGELYEVNGGHCSCYGLEGQWSPDTVSLKELENRLLNGTFGEDDWSDNNFKEELCKFLGVEYRVNKER